MLSFSPVTIIFPTDPVLLLILLLFLFECDDDDLRSFLMLLVSKIFVLLLLMIELFNLLSRYLYASMADFIPSNMFTSLTIVLGRCCKINWSRYLQYNVFKFYKEMVKGLLLIDIWLLCIFVMYIGCYFF